MSSARTLTVADLSSPPAPVASPPKPAQSVNPAQPVKKLTLTARSLKCTAVLDAAVLIDVKVADGIPRIPLTIEVAGKVLKTSIAAKSLRRAILAINEAGPENVTLVLQGKLVGDAIEDAGLAAQPKGPKEPKPEAIGATGPST